MFITISNSSAPRRRHSPASKRLAVVTEAPSGNPITVPIFTGVSRRRAAQNETHVGFTIAQANPYCEASSQSCTTCARVASGRSKV